jgi:hypothetical protein
VPRFRWRPSAALIIAATWLVYGVASLHRHGITSDEPALYHAGDRTLFWLTNPGLKDALAFDGPEPPAFASAFRRFPDHRDPMHYPVLTGFLAAITSEVFHKRLGWLDPTDGHHLALVLLHALGLYLFCRLATRLCGPLAGIAGTVALALYPSAVGHAFNNPKDWPCALYSGLATLAAGAGFVENRGRPMLAAGVLFGVALSCKLNAAIAMVAVVAAAPIAYLLLYHRRQRVSRGLLAGALALPYIAVGLFFLLWPWLYQGKGIAAHWQHLNEYMSFMLNYGSGDRDWWTAYPLRALLYMSPPAVLVAAAAGIAMAARHGRGRLAVVALLLLALWIPVLRIAAPRSNFYDANRHFIEYIPPLCMLAGLGVAHLAAWLRCRLQALPESLARRSSWLLAAPAALAVAALAWPILEYRPHEAAYFNNLVGGLGGAQRIGLFKLPQPYGDRTNGTEADYWWSSMREGIARARAIDPNAPVAVCGGAADMLPTTDPVPRWTGMDDPTALVYVCPREAPRFCPFATVRELEGKRPILHRVERGGGLVWELLGPVTGVRFASRTPENVYTRAP